MAQSTIQFSIGSLVFRNILVGSSHNRAYPWVYYGPYDDEYCLP